MKRPEKTTDIMISHNKIIIDERGFQEEDFKEGKVVKGYDEELGHLTIIDKDYGKSAELLRSIVEEDNTSPFVKYLVIGAIGILGIIVLVIIFNAFSKEETVLQPNEIVDPTRVPEEPDQVESTIQAIDSSCDIQSASHSIELREMSYNLNICNSERSRLDEIHSSEIIRMRSEIENLERENTTLQISEDRLKNTLSNYGSDAFYYDLGIEVFKKCENDPDDKIKENCEKLVYNYIKKGRLSQ